MKEDVLQLQLKFSEATNLQISMCDSVRVEVFNCFEDLINDKFGVVFIESRLIFFKDEVVEIATTEEREENDH
jgi:hypothetical protein